MPAFSTRFIDEERNRLREEGALSRQGSIDRSGNLEHPALASVNPMTAALSNAAPPPPTGRAPEGYPPASPTRASSQVAGAAPFNPSRGGSALGGGTYKPGNPTKKKPVNTTNKLFEDTDPLTIEDALEASTASINNTAKQNPAAFKQMDAVLTLKGIDSKAAFMDMRDNLIDAAAKRRSDRASKTYNEKEFKKRWKNIFNIIPEERMGMFLMDFGLRILAASTQPGNALTHAGIAGMGALGAMKEQQNIDNTTAREDEKFASEEARALVGLDQEDRRAGLDQQRVNIEEARRQDEAKDRNRVRPDDVIWTTEGAKYDYGDGKGPVPLGIGGKAWRPGDKPGGDGRREFQSEWMLRNLMDPAVGYTKREAMNIINGSPTEGEATVAFQKMFDNFDKYDKEIPPGGTEPKAYGKWTAKERQQWVSENARRTARGESSGALSPTSAPPQRPEGWDDY